MENFCIKLDNGVSDKVDYEDEDDFSKLHYREPFTFFSDDYGGFPNRVKKKFRLLGRSQSSKGVAYQRIGEEEINGEGRKKCSKFRFYLKKKRWAFPLPRARLGPLMEMLGRARDSYKKLCRKMHENPAVVLNSQWGIPNFYQPYYL
ncbi:hypothetical protein SUGI_0343000 [Cryptomeria japonica]|uniref:uncharacterized protein LOC131030843 n=1 Tax=Cryptomeria japonica TaxID=3369 RepID=UPI002408AAB8|nr:uncharacterized protein LOC131030843 [Cryptomeria japonica]GLJ19100.1 hypothetical protein SUGI_0343000 [Cryptomeria japonica]